MTTLPPVRPPVRGRRPVRERRGRERRVLYIGLALSFALHVVLVTLASLWLDPDVSYAPLPLDPTAAEPERGLRAVALAEAEAVVEPPAETPVARPTPPPVRRPQAPPSPATVEAEAVDRRTAAERLTPRMVDPRLWRPMIVLPKEPSFSEVQDRVARAIEMLSDSALAETERAMRARDWTVTDASGGRWGISPGQIHLGSITLPLPLSFPMDMEGLAQQEYWYELENQLQRAEFLENFDSRVRSIRERRDRERNERRPANDRGGR
jgi:hypothetical protein